MLVSTGKLSAEIEYSEFNNNIIIFIFMFSIYSNICLAKRMRIILQHSTLTFQVSLNN